MGKKYRVHSCLLQIKTILPNHSVACDHSATAEPKNPVPYCKIQGLLVFLQHATKSSLTEHVLSAHQISKCQEITQNELRFFVCLFLFEFHPSLTNCFLFHTFIVFYQISFLPAFLILQVQKQALLLQPASSSWLLSRVCTDFPCLALMAGAGSHSLLSGFAFRSMCPFSYVCPF